MLPLPREPFLDCMRGVSGRHMRGPRHVSYTARAGFDEGVAAYDRGDYETAFQEMLPLAEQGSARAQFNLGNKYNNGEGVTQDPAEAVKWYWYC